MSLTLHMIVRNEAATLPVCLKSIRDFVDDIVIVDTGSTDATIAIAQDYQCRVENFVWCNDFSAARNFALSLVKTPWTLWLDADDLVLNPEAIAPAIQYAQKNRIDGIYSLYKQEASCFQRRLHLFKPKAYQWEGAVHENPMPRKPTLSQAMLSDLVVEHRKPAERGPQAAQQYLQILLEKDPENWLGLAESYKYLFHNPDDPARKTEYRNLADQYFYQALGHPDINDWTRYYCHFQISWFNLYRSETEPQWFQIALKSAQMCISLRPDRAEGWGLMGLCWKLVGDYPRAIEAFETALRCEMPQDINGLVFHAYYDEIPKAELQSIKAKLQSQQESRLLLPQKKEIILPDLHTKF